MQKQKEFVVRGSAFSSQSARPSKGLPSLSLERMSARLNRELETKEGNVTYQGIRHLTPGNLTPLRSLIERHTTERGSIEQRGEVQDQLRLLQQTNRLAPIEPPMIHRPFSRYVSTVLIGD